MKAGTAVASIGTVAGYRGAGSRVECDQRTEGRSINESQVLPVVEEGCSPSREGSA